MIVYRINPNTKKLEITDDLETPDKFAYGNYVDILSIVKYAENKKSIYCKNGGLKPAAFYMNWSLAQLIKYSPFYSYIKIK